MSSCKVLILLDKKEKCQAASSKPSVCQPRRSSGVRQAKPLARSRTSEHGGLLGSRFHWADPDVKLPKGNEGKAQP